MSSPEILEQIRAVRNNVLLTEDEKRRQVELLMANSQRNIAMSVIEKSNVDNFDLSCSHYPTKQCSKLYFSCCGTIDPCKRCHMERDCHNPVVESIECNICGTRQPPGPQCSSCSIQFSKSYCGICWVWTDKEIFHCNFCQICRVGKADEVTHCHECECCYNSDIFPSHGCYKKSMRSVLCAICSESVYMSQKSTCILPCKHVVHHECVADSLRKGSYRCAQCRKSMVDMSRSWADMRNSISLQPLDHSMLPPIKVGDIVDSPEGDFVVQSMLLNSSQEYECEGDLINEENLPVHHVYKLSELKKKMTVPIHCVDCEQNCETKFHYIGLECLHCGGFNTFRA